MKKIPFYTIGLLLCLGFFLGIIFIDIVHDVQVDNDWKIAQKTLTYYRTMLDQKAVHGKIFLLVAGIMSVCSIRQLFSIHNRSMFGLFVLNLVALVYLFMDVLGLHNEIRKTKDDEINSSGDILVLLHKVKQNHLLLLLVLFSFVLNMIMIVRGHVQ